MTNATVRIIRQEHAALAAMLRSIIMLLEQHRRKEGELLFSRLGEALFTRIVNIVPTPIELGPAV